MVQIIAVPYALSRRDFGTGQGPQAILNAGLADVLAPFEPLLQTIDLPPDLDTDAEAIFGTNQLIADAAAASVAQNRFPLVLAGNCNSTVGAVSGLDKNDLGLVWLDAHGDFNTPDTTTTGFLDGMGLATLTGRCWNAMAAQVPGFSPLTENRIVHIGGRSLDPAEVDAFAASSIAVVSAAQIHNSSTAALEGFFAALRERGVRRVHLHLDLDVSNYDEAPANRYATPGGLSGETVLALLAALHRNMPIVSATIASYDPAVDPLRKTAQWAVRFAESIVSAHSPG